MTNNRSQAGPPTGAPDGDPPPLAPAETPGCLSQYLDEVREVIHQCARDADHEGAHLSRVTREPAMVFSDCVMWFSEHALEAPRPEPIPLRWTDETLYFTPDRLRTLLGLGYIDVRDARSLWGVK